MNAFLDNSPEAQRARLIDALRCGPVTRTTAREVLGITTIGSRIHELRRDGHAIRTVQAWNPTPDGLCSESTYVLAFGEANDGIKS